MPKSLKEWAKHAPKATICGEVEYSADTQYAQSVYLKNVFLIRKSRKIPIEHVRAFLKEKKSLRAGTVLVLSGRLQPVPKPRNPGEFDSAGYYAAQHIFYYLKEGVIQKESKDYAPWKQFLQKLRAALAVSLQRCAGRQAPVFEAVVLGEKQDLEPEQKLLYQMGGISHVMAISGLHISILGMGLFGLLRKTGMGNGAAGVLAFCVMLSYGRMTGNSLSALRAVCMFLVSVGAKICGRIYDMPTALALAAILTIMESPASICNCAFLLSFGAVLGLGTFVPVLEEILGVKHKIWSLLISSAGVQIFTLPVSLYFFGEVSLAGIFLNLAVLPTVGAVLVSGSVAAALGLFLPAVSKIVVFPGCCLLEVYEWLCRWAGRLPFCTWVAGRPGLWQILVYYLVLGAILLFLPKMQKKGQWLRRLILGAGLGAAAVILSWRPAAGFGITCLDVGQGDASVVKTAEGAHILIDGGSSNKSALGQYQLLPYLKSEGISYLEGIFISHTDEDHISGVRELLQLMGKGLTSVRAGMLVLPEWSQEPEAYKELCALAKQAGVSVARVSAGDRFSLGSVSAEVLWPEAGAAGENVNEEAMVLRLSYGAFAALFTGDIGLETEERLLEKGRLTDVDFLKVAHHGSRHSTGEAFLAAVRPETAVVSASVSNTYGHPGKETLERLKAAGTKVWCTKDCGAVTLTVRENRVRVEGFLEEEG